jgi:hypothetical protein
MYLKHLKKPLKGLSKTGQTVSYQLGDDGYYQKGLPKAGERFVDNADGTVTDKVTGLMFVKDPSQIPGGLWGTPGSPVTMSWANALTNCEALVYAGYSDWRLPNIKELQSIAEYGRNNPAINIAYFPNTRTSYYWTATTYFGNTAYAWIVYFYSGSITYTTKTSLYYVRPVRLG